METKLISDRNLIVGLLILMVPVIIVIFMSFIYTDGINSHLTISGFKELSTPIRIQELLSISLRALLVSIIATIIAFIIAVFISSFSSTNQTIYLSVLTIPFLINESIRVFSWQHFLSVNGGINKLLSCITNKQIAIFNGANFWNVYVVMIITCIPLGVFIFSAAIKIIPNIYLTVAKDLNMTPFYKTTRIILPLCKFAVVTSLTVIFFISFSQSTEVNYLGGDTKISIRNLILSLMSAGKFQAIYALGSIIIVLLILFIYFIHLIQIKSTFSKNK